MDFSVVSTVIPVFRLFEPGRVSVNVFNEEKPIASMKGRRLAGRNLDRLLAQQRTHKVYKNRSAVPWGYLSYHSQPTGNQECPTLGYTWSTKETK